MFLVALAIAIAAGGSVGVVTGMIVGSGANAGCSPSDSWCELGGLVYGFVGGLVVGFATYVVAGIVTIRRYRPRGRRAGHIAAHLIAVVALPTLLAAVADVVPM